MTHKKAKTGVKKALITEKIGLYIKSGKEMKPNWQTTHKPYGGVYEKKGMDN